MLSNFCAPETNPVKLGRERSVKIFQGKKRNQRNPRPKIYLEMKGRKKNLTKHITIVQENLKIPTIPWKFNLNT
jgi:hypothetical protein